MRRKHEMVKGRPISCWDNGEKWADRFTVVFLDEITGNKVNILAMGPTPFHPQGFCQHGEMDISAVAYRGRGGAFDKRIKFADLPPDCQKAVIQDLEWDDLSWHKAERGK